MQDTEGAFSSPYCSIHFRLASAGPHLWPSWTILILHESHDKENKNRYYTLIFTLPSMILMIMGAVVSAKSHLIINGHDLWWNVVTARFFGRDLTIIAFLAL